MDFLDAKGCICPYLKIIPIISYLFLHGKIKLSARGPPQHIHLSYTETVVTLFALYKSITTTYTYLVYTWVQNPNKDENVLLGAY